MSTVEVLLPDEYKSRLASLAMGTGITQDEAVRRALDLLFQSANLTDEEMAAGEWQALGLAAFARDWNNEEDAVYDDWRARYGVAG